MSGQSCPVMSGFCSEPESANSFSTIRCVATNHEWSYCWRSGVARRIRSVPSVSCPGIPGTGNRRPSASNHIDDGPGRIRMPWSGQIGSKFRMPSV